MRLLERLQRSGFGGTEIELIDAGDDVLVTVSHPRLERGEGWPEQAATVITFRDGKAIHLWQFKTPDQALAAAQRRQLGTSEHDAAARPAHARSTREPAEYTVPILPSRDLDETLAFYERPPGLPPQRSSRRGPSSPEHRPGRARAPLLPRARTEPVRGDGNVLPARAPRRPAPSGMGADRGAARPRNGQPAPAADRHSRRTARVHPDRHERQRLVCRLFTHLNHQDRAFRCR
jgi:hypothetical protein